MIHLTNKAKQYGLIALKVLILTATIWFIYQKVKIIESLQSELMSVLPHENSLRYLGIFILLALVNWTLEILKWKTLVGSLGKISYKTAAKQCLMSLSASLVTPNRIGEYGAKALYFEPKQRKKIMVLNLYSNVTQLFATLLFGIPGLLIFMMRYKIALDVWKLTVVCGILVLLLIVAYHFRRKELLIKGLSLHNIVVFIQQLKTSVKLGVLGYALLRYMAFSSLFYLLLIFFGSPLNFWSAIPLITSMYLLASVVPSFFIFDVAIKGGVSLWLFSFTDTGELTVLCTILLMWFLNFGIPAIWGSFYVARFKLVKA